MPAIKSLPDGRPREVEGADTAFVAEQRRQPNLVGRIYSGFVGGAAGIKSSAAEFMQ